MFKLVGVGGKVRGKEFIIDEGINSFGRSSQCTHQLSLSGVSKKHFQVNLEAGRIEIKDLGSANGTIVNNKVIKRRDLQVNDLIALPNGVLKLIYSRDDISENESFEAEMIDSEQESSLVKKPIWFFKTKVMPVIYQMNEAYEWKYLLGIFLFLFLSINIFLTIGPILQDTNKLLLSEIRMRGSQYVSEVARVNSGALSRGEFDKIDTLFLDSSKDITSYLLFDREGRILRPKIYEHQYFSDSFAVEARNWISQKRENYQKDYFQRLSDGTIGVARAILGRRGQSLNEEIMGYIVLHFTPTSLAIKNANSRRAYLVSLALSCAVGLIFFGFIYYSTVNPINELKNKIEDFQRGKIKEIDLQHLMQEIKPLTFVINSILIRNRELTESETGEVFEAEDDRPYLNLMKDICQMSGGAVLILDSEKNISALNYEGEELMGIRESLASGTNLLDTLREQGMAATILDLCDQSAADQGDLKEDHYEIGGVDHRVLVRALSGVKDQFNKGYIVTFIRE